MKVKSLQNNIKVTDFENFFNVYEDSRRNYSYNLNETMYFNVSDYKTYTLKTDAFWPLISYKLYSTTRLAWLLMKINEVKANEMFEKKHAGDVIKYVDKGIVESIVQTF